MPHAYTEEQLVEQPAIGLFAELGWTTVSALEETLGAPSPGLAATLSHPMGEGASVWARDEGRGGVGVPVVPPTGGNEAIESRGAAGGYHCRRG
jgi:type I restriction enzyme R subunit